ncbi:TPA: hypothetical protein I7730_01305 [Vibrio vulnificus]|uniref:Uncharacterized protein n=1 Tax=Vibrio vulnificus TaxID=672 RepID=A0A8H9K7B2_VIBVL|nr:hypothetical protein [Vibrio vulnificus]HAS8538434.1 hypothetical protein [Vibrio vulnificus]
MKKLILQRLPISAMDNEHMSPSLSSFEMLRDVGLLLSMIEVDSDGNPLNILQLFENADDRSMKLMQGQSHVILSDVTYNMLHKSS